MVTKIRNPPRLICDRAETPNPLRRAFTLVELLVVITIVLLLATLTFAVFNTGRSSDKVRSAARVAQSAFLGAKDRALHAGNLRGVRLIYDSNDNAGAIPALVNSFVYLQPITVDANYPGRYVYPSGSIELERIDVNQDSVADGPPDTGVIIVRGFDSSSPTSSSTIPPPPQSPPNNPVNWAQISSFFTTPGRIRIPADTGQWYPFFWNTSGPYALGQGNEVLQLMAQFSQTGNAYPVVVAWNTGSSFSSCEIELIAEPLPFHSPIAFSSGIVIDISNSSTNVQSLSGFSAGSNMNIDIMFSPRGMISGFLAGVGPLHFAIRDIQDASIPDPNPLWTGQRLDPANQLSSTNPSGSPGIKGDILILSIFPQTGLVQTFEADLTDVVNNTTNAAGADGHADNLFRFAQAGMSAGR